MTPEQTLNTFAERQYGVFSLDQAVACGLSVDAVLRRARGGRFKRVHRGVYVLAGILRRFEPKLMAALLAAGGEAFASHGTAARLHGLGEGARLEISVPWQQNPFRPRGVAIHRVRRLVADDLTTEAGFRVTTVARTLLDLAGRLDRDSLELLLDKALSMRKVTREELLVCLERAGRGRRGTACLRALLDERKDGHAKVESPLEQRLHRILDASNLPRSEKNWKFRIGERRGRLDVAFVPQRVAIEIDSYRHHSSRSDWSNDHERRNALIAAGWRVLAVTAKSIDERPAHVARLIREALAAAVT